MLRPILGRGGSGQDLRVPRKGADPLAAPGERTSEHASREEDDHKVFPSEEATRSEFASGREKDWQPIAADPTPPGDDGDRAGFSAIEAAGGAAILAYKVVPVGEVEGTALEQVMVGSCTIFLGGMGPWQRTIHGERWRRRCLRGLPGSSRILEIMSSEGMLTDTTRRPRSVSSHLRACAGIGDSARDGSARACGLSTQLRGRSGVTGTTRSISLAHDPQPLSAMNGSHDPRKGGAATERHYPSSLIASAQAASCSADKRVAA